MSTVLYALYIQSTALLLLISMMMEMEKNERAWAVIRW
jgi:hypothetical protein